MYNIGVVNSYLGMQTFFIGNNNSLRSGIPLTERSFFMIKSCEMCKNNFDGREKFCSKRCWYSWSSKNKIGEKSFAWKGGKTKKNCLVCNKEFFFYPHKIGIKKFCSYKCKSASQKGLKHSDNIIQKMKLSHMGLNTWMKGRKLSSITRKKMSESHKGKNIWSKGRKLTEEHCKKLSESHKGNKSSFWKGGISHQPYNNPDWTRILRSSIRERDKYICRLCGKQQNKYSLDVHHINYIKSDCNPDNLITLCNSCHAKTNSDREYWKNYFIKIMR